MADGFTVQLARSAVGDLDAIPDRLRSQIVEAIKSLADNPLPMGSGVKKLKGFKPPLYRLRSRDYRVLYRIHSSTIQIMRIIDRKELERTIKRLHL
jgi:mRNA-degrading endonuclease RelE of RelBE toxin-antitoxin system